MKFLHTSLLAIALSSLHAPSLHAQTWADVLQQIEQNNLELQAADQQTLATQLEAKRSLNLPDPEVSYSSVYTNGTAPGHGTEFSATQSFNFPTYYLSQHKNVKLQREAATIGKQVVRRNVLLSAKLLCIDLTHYQQTAALLDLRQQRADNLVALLTNAETTGDVSALTTNRIALERLNIRTAAAQNDASLRTALQQLQALNGGRHLAIGAMNYPLVSLPKDYDALADQVIPKHLDVNLAHSATAAAEQEVRVARQNNLPRLTAGFKRSTDLANSMNGFVVGMSIPIFSNRSATRAAKAQAQSQRLRSDEAALQAQAWLMSLHNEAMKLSEALSAIDAHQLQQNLTLLDLALGEHHITLTDYYTECEAIYSALQTRLNLEQQYQRIVAEIYSNEL